MRFGVLLHAPGRQHLSRLVPLDGPHMRPCQQVASSLGAQTPRVRGDTDPTQVQPVRVPARQQRAVPGRVPIGVQPARLEQQLEPVVVEVDQLAPQRPGELGGLGSIMGSFFGAFFIIILPIVLNQLLPVIAGWFGVEISTAGVSHAELIIFGGLIVWFLIVEPHGLAKLWSTAKQKLQLWPFPH